MPNYFNSYNHKNVMPNDSKFLQLSNRVSVKKLRVRLIASVEFIYGEENKF